MFRSLVAATRRRGHSVVTTTRTQAKASGLLRRYAQHGKDVFDVVIVEDIAVEAAFDQAVVSTPPFDAVCHPTSPFYFDVTDIQKELLEPAIMGTIGILRSIKAHAPSVRRVVITSSLASMIHPWQGDWPGNWPGHVYTEADWNPITLDQALADVLCGYRFSKKQAEQAAWNFLATESPNFTLQTICPPLMLGPTASGDLWEGSLAHVNESLKRVRDICFGKARAENEIPPNGASFVFTDVRDAAHYHVLALERPEEVSERYFIPTGWFANEDIARIARDHFHHLAADCIPLPGTPGGGWPQDGMYTVDNSHTRNAFPDLVTFYSLETCIVDTVRSLLAVVASASASSS